VSRRLTRIGLGKHRVRWTSVLVCLLAGCHAPETNETTVGQNSHRTVLNHAVSRPEPAQSHSNSNSPFQTVPTGILSLYEALRIGLSANPDVRAAAARLEAASARLSEAKSRYAPTVEFVQASFRAFQLPESLEGVAGLIGPGSLGSTLGVSSLFSAFRAGSVDPFSEHSTVFSASWVLFDGFLRQSTVEAARHIENAARFAAWDVRRMLIRAIEAAFYQIQLSEERLRVARADEAFNIEEESTAEKLREAGRASSADALNFRVRLLAARAEVALASGLLDAARVALAELMGVPDAMLSEQVNVEPLGAEIAADLANPDIEQKLRQAMSDRPDLKQLEEVVRSEEAGIRAAKSLYWPSIALAGSWGFDRTSNLAYSEDDQSSAGGIAFRWEVFSGGRRKAKVRQADSARDEASAGLSRLRIAVASEVRRAGIHVIDAQRQVALQRETLEAARENRRVVQAAYRAGKESSSRLNEVQRDCVTAEAHLVTARIRLRQAWSEMHSAVGHTTSDMDSAPLQPLP